MTVLVDPPAWPAHGRLWSHLVSDTSLAELHAFAAGVAVPRRAFEGDHYDVPAERHADLVAAGAVPVTGRELLSALQRSGLRRPKRRGERVLTSRWLSIDERVDVVSSPLPVPGRPSGRQPSVVLLLHPDGLLLEPGGALSVGPDLHGRSQPLGHLRFVPSGSTGAQHWRVVPVERREVATAGVGVPTRGLELVRRCGGALWWPLLMDLRPSWGDRGDLRDAGGPAEPVRG